VLDQTAVLIVRHGPTGSSGFIINRATQFTVGDVTKKLPVFEQNRLFLGGDIGEGVYMIHGVPGLRNATQVSEGLYYGGSEHAMELVQKGKARSEDFRFFFKYTAWAPGALQAEVQAGCWCPIKTSLDLVLRPKQHEIHFSKAHKVYWHELLKTLGGRFDNISSETLRKEEMERAKMEEWVTLLQDGSNVSVPDHEFVENGALAMASVAGQIPPELGEKVYTQIEAVTAATQKALGGDAAPAETLRALSAEFFKTFSAVSAEDAPPTALLVDRVAASQQGEPLALAPLYMAAARALGVPLRALNCSTQMRFGAELYLRYDAPREATAEEKEPEPRDDSDALFVALGEAGAVMSKDECRGKLPEEMQDDASMQPMPHVQLYSRVMHKMANSLAAKNEEQEVLVWLQQIRILQAAINTVTIMHLEEEARRDPEKFRRAQEAARAAAQERARQVEGGGQPRELFLKDIIKDDQVLLAGGGKTVTGADLKGKVVALYFSASWCAPCKQFTPKLIQTYSKLVVADGKDFEVVFVSVDRDQESFDAYFNQMPWLALEWANADERASISQACQVPAPPRRPAPGTRPRTRASRLLPASPRGASALSEKQHLRRLR